MKIVYIILAHNQPKHLHRLVWALHSPDVEMFIHIDLNSDISEFMAYQFPKNVTFLEKRFTIFHGGYSYLLAMIHSLIYAYQNSEVSNFQFLSGWDYPIKNKHFHYWFLCRKFSDKFHQFLSTDW